MTTHSSATGEPLVHCYERAAEIRRSAEIRNARGVRQQQATRPLPTSGTDTQQPTGGSTGKESTDLLAEYSILQWIVAAVVGLVSFPIGLIVPGYLFYKAQSGTGNGQSGLEAWTAILLGIVGIIAVEIGGRTAAKVLWGLVVVSLILITALVVGV